MEHETQPSAKFDPRLPLAVDTWKRKLLDLSMRNRLLNFRSTRVSTVTVHDEQPAEVFRQIFLLGESMRFRPMERAEVHAGIDSEPEAESDTLAGEVHNTQVGSIEFEPYSREELADRHVDDILQTTSTPEQLKRSLLRIETLAKGTLEEQGVNTLFLALGMLHYRDSESSAEFRKAPLVLLPVSLDRRNARSGFTVSSSGDDPLLNPALVELLRRNTGIVLPDLPSGDALDEGYDLQQLLKAILDTVSTMEGWRVTNDIYLGLFSFQKFVMYKDLEANASSLINHRVIQRIVTRAGEQHLGLPEDIRSPSLDEVFPPEATAQVVDADASQLRALLAVEQGHDLVIEGPPGTGKSQTITNLIAQALSNGKSVLFVAEKMAALEVVASRLRDVGLGEFCLEMHSSKASKSAVIKQIAASLDASLSRLDSVETVRDRLPDSRSRISDYVRAVHAPYGAMSISPYRAYGELAQVIDAPRLRLHLAPEGVTAAAFDSAVRALEELAAAATAVEPLHYHPYRDSHRTFFSEALLEEVRERANSAVVSEEEISALALQAESSLGLPRVRAAADVEVAVELAAILARSPGAPVEVLTSEAWNTTPPDAEDLVARGRCLTAQLAEIRNQLLDTAADQDPTADLAFVEERLSRPFGFMAWLNGRYRAIARRWKSYRLPNFRGSMVDQLVLMRQVVEVRTGRSALSASRTRARELFGKLWRGDASNWDELERYIAWVVDFRAASVRHSLGARAVGVAAIGQPDVGSVKELRTMVTRLRADLDALGSALEWPDHYLEDTPFRAIADRAQSIVDGWRLGPRWAGFESTRQAAEQGLAAEVLVAALAGEVGMGDIVAAFRRAFWMQWLEAVVTDRPALRGFHGLTHEQRLAEFRDLDQRMLGENRRAVVTRLREFVQRKLRDESAQEAMPFLRREMARQRGHKPVRTTLAAAGTAVRAIQPCFMMSPLTVAQLLDGSEPSFDLVIFDEASQLPTEDAVGAILRGRQLVVVGDPKQLPPTNFFAVANGQVEPERDEDGNILFEDTESVLEEFMGAGAPPARLKWHYRSTDESLIAFSNAQFYDSELMTFPSVWFGGGNRALQFEHVAEGVYEGKGVNWKEAQQVADAVVEHARRWPSQSLGVGTFSTNQQYAILDLLEERRRREPDIEPFFASRVTGGFFVKNLENIQGDERDVIFISVTYAKARDGRLRFHFGPLNQQNGWRRLNVLVTRARHRMRVFSSIRSHDFHLEATTSTGARLLHDFLAYAETGRLDSPVLTARAETESPFERQVYNELTRRGLTLRPQVGVSGYRIDFGVMDSEVQGRFICGIECDGASYHRSETARDRDRLRQQVLEDRGWTIHRLWSTDWFKDRQGQIERLMVSIERTRQRVHEEASPEVAAYSPVEKSPRDVVHPGQASGPTEGGADRNSGYSRPVARPYQAASGDTAWMRRKLLEASPGQLVRTAERIIEVEAPIHIEELIARAAALWGTKAGSRIADRLRRTVIGMTHSRRITMRDDFVWGPETVVEVRSRAALQNPSADHIAPEEYDEAVRSILRSSVTLTHAQLIVETRALLGFQRTGARLELQIDSAIKRLLASGEAGEGSAGLVSRDQENTAHSEN
jgi:very-short-patch-repair endonuclease